MKPTWLKLVSALAVFVVPALAQQSAIVTRTSSLSSSAEVLTLQQPASGGKAITFKGIYIDTTVAVTVTLERNGSAASATALTPVYLNFPGTPTLLAWRSSNSSGGTGSTRAQP